MRDQDAGWLARSYVCPHYEWQLELPAIDLEANVVVLVVSQIPECGGTIVVPRVDHCDGIQRVEFSHVSRLGECVDGCELAIPFGRLVEVPKGDSIAVQEVGPCIR